MILLDALIVKENPTGIGIYTIHVAKYLRRYIDFHLLTSTPESFPDGIRKIKATKLTRNPLFRTLYIQTLTDSFKLLYRTYHNVSIMWKGIQVITIHDLLPIHFPQRYKAQYYLYRYFLKRNIHKVDLIVTVSERSKRDISEYFNVDEDRIKVFYPSYDEELLKYSGNHRKDRENFLLMVGAQYIHKNPEVVMKALAHVRHLSLRVVGTSRKYEMSLRKLAHELGISDRVSFIAYASKRELAELYARAFALVVPSKYEGFGIPVLEAFLFGTPVIGTYAVREAGGDAIVYADPEELESWIWAFDEVDSNRELYVRKGYERLKMFSWKTTAEGIARVLKHLL